MLIPRPPGPPVPRQSEPCTGRHALQHSSCLLHHSGHGEGSQGSPGGQHPPPSLTVTHTHTLYLSPSLSLSLSCSLARSHTHSCSQAVKLFSNTPPPQTILLSAYIELMSGQSVTHTHTHTRTHHFTWSIGNASAALHQLKVAHPYPHGMDSQKKPRKTAATYLAMKH